MEIETKYMPVKEYAILKKISVQAVYQQINRGVIGHKKIGSYTLVKVA